MHELMEFVNVNVLRRHYAQMSEALRQIHEKMYPILQFWPKIDQNLLFLAYILQNNWGQVSDHELGPSMDYCSWD